MMSILESTRMFLRAPLAVGCLGLDSISVSFLGFFEAWNAIMVSFPGSVQNGLNRFSVGTGTVPLQYRSKTDCVQLREREKALSREKLCLRA